jgi:membrane fusion protein, multidrug efflux system
VGGVPRSSSAGYNGPPEPATREKPAQAVEWFGEASSAPAARGETLGWEVRVWRFAGMKVGRLASYGLNAVLAVGAAYFIWFETSFSTAVSNTTVANQAPPPAAKKAEGKGGRSAQGAPVTAAMVVERDMPVILTAPGTVEPLANVAVKPRVDGQIVEVAFAEGDLVQEGSVLFRLDDRIAKALIAQAEANITKDEASLRDAEATLARREALIDKKIVTEAALDQARYAVAGFKASITAGRALLDTQKTLLDYLTIRAPISGRTGSLSAKLGATVRAQDAPALVTINQTKPILVTFAVPQSELPALKRALLGKATADVTIPGGDRPTVVPGIIGFVDNQVDRQTGTITAKVVATNAEEVLWPGLSVEVALTVEVKPRMLAVPAAAVLPAQQGMIAWVIGPDNKVAVRVVTVERIVGQMAYLAAGVKAGEQVVTDGQIRLAPGMAVNIEEPRSPPKPAPATEERRLNGRG